MKRRPDWNRLMMHVPAIRTDSYLTICSCGWIKWTCPVDVLKADRAYRAHRRYCKARLASRERGK